MSYWTQRRRILLSVVVNLPTDQPLSAVLAAGAGAALAGVLRAGDCAAPVDPPPCHDLRGEKVPHQLWGNRGEILCEFHAFRLQISLCFEEHCCETGFGISFVWTNIEQTGTLLCWRCVTVSAEERADQAKPNPQRTPPCATPCQDCGTKVQLDLGAFFLVYSGS